MYFIVIILFSNTIKSFYNNVDLLLKWVVNDILAKVDDFYTKLYWLSL